MLSTLSIRQFQHKKHFIFQVRHEGSRSGTSRGCDSQFGQRPAQTCGGATETGTSRMEVHKGKLKGQQPHAPVLYTAF